MYIVRGIFGSVGVLTICPGSVWVQRALREYVRWEVSGICGDG